MIQIFDIKKSKKNLKSNNKYEYSYFYNIIDKYYDDSTYYVDSVKIEDMAKDKDVPFGGRIAVKKKVEKSDKAINIHFIIGLVIAIFVVMSIGILKIKNSKGKYKRSNGIWRLDFKDLLYL